MSYDKNNDKGRNFKKASKGGESEAVVVSDNNEFAHEPVQGKHLEVKVYNNMFDKALRAFRALVQKERILSTFKENQSYEKPSDRKRRKHNEMKRKLLELENPREPREFKPRKNKEE